MKPIPSEHKDASWLPKTFEHTITMCDRDTLFMTPPAGHAGVIVWWELSEPNCRPGDRIIFKLQGEEVAEGRITFLEKPNSCVRPDLRNTTKAFGKWKIHWFMVSHSELLDEVINCHKCPKCGARSSVYDTRYEGNKILRYRRCPKGHGRWLTLESFFKVVHSKVKKSRKPQ